MGMDKEFSRYIQAAEDQGFNQGADALRSMQTLFTVLVANGVIPVLPPDSDPEMLLQDRLARLRQTRYPQTMFRLDRPSIKAALARAGKTQRELALLADINEQTVSRNIRGLTKSRFPNLLRMSTVLNVDPSEIIHPDDKEKFESLLGESPSTVDHEIPAPTPKAV